LVPLGIIAALAFYSYWKKEKAGNALSVVTFFLSLVVIGLMSWVGLTGGEIRHTEIRKDNTSFVPSAADQNQETEMED
jgi:uncharacterized membrane protein